MSSRRIAFLAVPALILVTAEAAFAGGENSPAGKIYKLSYVDSNFPPMTMLFKENGTYSLVSPDGTKTAGLWSMEEDTLRFHKGKNAIYTVVENFKSEGKNVGVWNNAVNCSLDFLFD